MTRIPPERLSEAAILEELEDLPGWTLDEGKLHKTFTFSDFTEAFGWMTSCAIVAEKRNHHPEWLNVYATVKVDLRTHESGGITERDVDLAQRMEKLAAKLC